MMTARELRQMLFAVDNQRLTVKALRALLFTIEDQDKELDKIELTRLTRKENEE